jgi:dienelactone hydrolase
MRTILLIFLATLLPAVATADLRTRTVDYRDGNVTLEGFVAYADAEGRRPGVLVVPDWMGLGDHYRNIAKKLAEMGYVAFAADIYGKGVRPANAQEASAEASKYKSNRPLMRQRVLAGLEELKKLKEVDPNRIVAIGYCFGGTTVLELARSGADIRGVVSFHGGLDSPNPDDGKKIKAKVLVLHGADDPFVPPKDVAAFQEELRKGGVDWQMMYYGNNVHAFTTTAAGTDKKKGAAYDETADKRSWQQMQLFFKEIFEHQGMKPKT